MPGAFGLALKVSQPPPGVQVKSGISNSNQNHPFNPYLRRRHGARTPLPNRALTKRRQVEGLQQRASVWQSSSTSLPAQHHSTRPTCQVDTARV